MNDDIWLNGDEEPPSPRAGLVEEEEEPPSFRTGLIQSEEEATFAPPESRRARAARTPAVWPPASRKHPRVQFDVSERSVNFLQRFFPAASLADWTDWHWQVRNSFRSPAELAKIIFLSEEERAAITRQSGGLPLRVTPYYASLLDPVDAQQPLRRSVIPVTSEFVLTPGEADDPLGEDADSPVPGLVHRYPDRVLFLATGFCSTYCRYCTRSRMVGHHGDGSFNPKHWEQAIAYIAATPSVRDVLISGGDPLTLADSRLEWLLSRLRRIPHVEFLRIGTKVPAVLPHRVTPSLTRMLKRYHPLFISVHFTHPDELTTETRQACNRLADAGIPLGSQTVLLKGINDEVETMRRLVHGLLKVRVRPYYLYQCDPISGSGHFRTSVEKGLEIIRGLRGHTTGYAVPTYVIDAPGGGGKIPLLPDSVAGRDGEDLLLRNFEGEVFRYPDNAGSCE